MGFGLKGCRGQLQAEGVTEVQQVAVLDAQGTPAPEHLWVQLDVDKVKQMLNL
jgi:hypothetical protein